MNRTVHMSFRKLHNAIPTLLRHPLFVFHNICHSVNWSQPCFLPLNRISSVGCGCSEKGYAARVHGGNQSLILLVMYKGLCSIEGQVETGGTPHPTRPFYHPPKTKQSKENPSCIFVSNFDPKPKYCQERSIAFARRSLRYGERTLTSVFRGLGIAHYAPQP